MSRLDPRLLLQGYAAGIFPMADSREASELFWVEPRSRAIIPLEKFHLSRSLRRTLRSGNFAVLSPVGDVQERPAEIRWERVQSVASYQVRLLEVDRSEVWKVIP